MKTLIKQIEGLKCKGLLNDEEVAYNDGISDVINLIQSLPVIRAKALRKRGTENDWYEYDKYRMSYIMSDYPKPCHELVVMAVDILPKDAELIPLTIIVGEGGEK